MKRVFCVGNGESRRNVNLEVLRKFGKIYGCNAMYRDFTPDVLVAVDQVLYTRYIKVVMLTHTSVILETGIFRKRRCFIRLYMVQMKT